MLVGTSRRSPELVQIPTNIGVVADDLDLSTITTADAIFAVAALIVALLLSRLAKRTLRRVLDDVESMPESGGEIIARIVSYVILTLGVVFA